MIVPYQKSKINVYGRRYEAYQRLSLGQGLVVAERCESQRNFADESGVSSSRARSRGGAPREMTVAKLRLAMAAMGQRETEVGDPRRERG